jgi:hypothetical protein
MLSDKYLWPVSELTPVHETYKLVPFQELVTEVHNYDEEKETLDMRTLEEALKALAQ